MLLLEDEKNVIKWLSQYGALRKTQLIRMLQKPKSTAEKIIRNLKNDLRLEILGDGYYVGLDSMSWPDQKMLTAVWVLLEFVEKIDPMGHYPATYPSQIFFLKENVGYEIVVLYEDETNLLRLIQVEEDLKYIVVVPHISMAKKIKVPKNMNCLFATVDFNGAEEPNVHFYTVEK